MVVAIAGMHRSGTSVTTKLLRLCGLYLGNEQDLLPAVDYNSDGLWENSRFVELNEEIIALYGGTWELPPDFATRVSGEDLEHVRMKSRQLIDDFKGQERWGWKDPRNSLTLPFWQDEVPNLKVVVCLRNPLEVALSLRRRGYPSVMSSLNLWRAYNERILVATTPHNRIIIHYDALSDRPEYELDRLLQGLGMPASEAALAQARSEVFDTLRHGRFRASDLIRLGNTELSTLYLQLCEEAGWTDCVAPRAGDVVAGPRQNGQLASPQREAVDLQRKTEFDLLRQAIEIEQLRKETEAAAATITVLNQRLAHADTLDHQLAESRDLLSKQWDGLKGDLQAIIHQEIRDRFNELEQNLLNRLQPTPTTVSSSDQQPRSYRRMLARIHRHVRRTVPRHARVLVVSKGDERLLDLPGRHGQHFPQTADGTYAGAHPACSLAAIAQVEALRLQGADFLLFPSTAFWWLDYYQALQEHLKSAYRLLLSNDVCRVFDLRAQRRAAAATGASACQELIRECELRLGRPPTILDWNTGLDLARLLAQYTVFSPPGAEPPLPYLDHSVDVVILPLADHLLNEGRRVAHAAVISVEPSDSGTDVPICRAKWYVEPSAEDALSVSLIVSPPADPRQRTRYLDTLRSRLPQRIACEILVLDAGDRQLNGVSSDSYAQACNEMAKKAMGDILVFLGRPVIPLPEWLSSVTDLFGQEQDLAAIAPKLVSRDGHLEQAGGVVFSDGSLDAFGGGDYQVEDPLYGFVRKVDFSGDAVLITKRAPFVELEGFNSAYRSAGYVHADYCLRAGQRGLRTVYQPECVLVSLSAPVDSSSADESDQPQRFEQQWRQVLSGHWPAPHWRDRDAWQAMLVQSGNLVEAL